VHSIDYLRTLVRRWRILLAGALLGVGVAVDIVLWTTPMYAVTTTFYVSSTDRAPTATTAYEASLLAQQQVQSYATLLGSERVAQELAARLSDGLTAAQLQGKIGADVVPQTALLVATVTDGSRTRAHQIATALGPVFAAVVESLEQPPDGGPSPVRVTVVDSASAPSTVSPRPLRDLVLGLTAGLLIAGLAAVLREATDTSVKSLDVLRGLTGGPVLASVGTQDKAQRQMLREHRSPNTEAYRSLRTNLQFLDVDHPVRVLTVTSSIPGEGKSLTACNLALALADAGKRVVLVDGDLRCPQVCAYMGCTSRAGLTSVLIGASLLEEALIEGRNRLLRIMPSGPIPPNPSELLGSARMAELLERLKQDADIVVIDSPPLLPVTDAAILSHLSDGAILVVRHGQTRREQLARATDQLRAVEARLLGSVLNRVPSRGPDADPYLAYGYYNSAQPAAPLPGLVNGASLLGIEDWRVNVGGTKATAQSRPANHNHMTGQS